jgi:hypothetical protein
VSRATLPPPAPAHVYELTDRGRELEPVLLALGRFGRNAPFPPEHGQLSPEALVVALKTVFDPAAADGLSGSFELRLDGLVFVATVGDQGLEIARGPSDRPLAVPHAVRALARDAATAACPKAIPPSLGGRRSGTSTRRPARCRSPLTRSSSTRFWNEPPERTTS